MKSPKRSFLDNDLPIVSLLVAFALLVRLFFLWQGTWVISPDSVLYLSAAEGIRNGYLSQINIIHPFYPLVIALITLVFNNLELAGMVSSMMLSSLLIVPVFLLARDLYGQKTATISSVLVIFYPLLTDYSCRVAVESAYTFMFLSAIWVTWLAIKRKRDFLYVLSGVMFALVYLTRPNGAPYILVIPLLLFIFNLSESKRNTTFRIFLFVASFIIIVFPYLLFLHHELRYWTFSGYLQGTREGSFMQQIWRNPSSHIVPIVKRMVKVGYRGYVNVFPQMFPPLMIALAALGIVKREKNGYGIKREAYLMVFVITHTFTHLPFFGFDTRYLMPTLPILLIWAGRGIEVLQEWFIYTVRQADWKKLNPIRAVLLMKHFVLVLVFISLLPEMLVPVVGSAVGSIPIEPIEYKQTGLWMKEHLPAGSIVMSRKPQAGWYAGMKTIGPPDLELPQIFEYARSHKVDYLVVDERWTAKLAPHLKLLLDETKAPDELKLVYKQDDVAGIKILVYELLEKKGD